MMDARYIRQHRIIERYLRHELSEEEDEAFERYYFEHPEILPELEELQSRLRPASLLPEPPEGLPTFPPPQPASRMAFVRAIVGPTSTLMALVLTVLLVAQVGTSAGSPVSVVADLSLQGESASTELTIPREGVVSLTIDASRLDPNSVQGILRSSHATIKLPLRPDPQDRIARLVVPTRNLPTGAYKLDLSDARGARVAYRINVTH